MPNRTELEEIVVRFAPDAADYLNVLKQVKDQTKDSAAQMKAEGDRLAESLKTPLEQYKDKLTRVGELYKNNSITAETYAKAIAQIEKEQTKVEKVLAAQQTAKDASYLKNTATYAQSTLDVVKNVTALMEAKANSTGESLKTLGNIVGAMPGPWAAAGAAILGVIGNITDFLQRRLLKAQQSVRDAFHGIASGASTAEQAMGRIVSDTMVEGMDRLTRRIQARQREGGATNSPRDLSEIQNFMRFAREAQELFRDVENNLGIQAGRLFAATNRAMTEGVVRAEAMPMRRMQRQMMRGMHGDNITEAEAMRAQMRFEALSVIQEVRRSTGESITEAQAIRQLEQQNLDDRARQAAAQGSMPGLENVPGPRPMGRLDRLRQQVRENIQNQRTDRAVEGMDTFARSLDETANAMGRQNALFRTFQEGVDGTRDSYQQATTTNESLTRQEQIHTQVLARRDAQERLALANTDNLDLATRRRLQRIVETTDARIAEMRAADQQMRQAELQRNAMQEGYQLTQQLREPTRVYGEEINQLSALLGRGAIAQDTYRRGVEAANQAFRQADPTFRSYFAAVDQGVGLVQQFRNPLEGVREQVGQLGVALAQGRITNEEYETTLGRIQAQADKSSQSLLGISGAATGSAEAMARMNAQQERLRTPMLSVVTREEGRQAVGAQIRRGREAAAPLTPEQMERGNREINDLDIQPREGIPIAPRNAPPDFTRQNSAALDRAARALERLAMTPQQRAEQDQRNIREAIEQGIRLAFEVANFPGAGG